MKFEKLLLLLSFALFASACSHGGKSRKPVKEFEGILTYKVSYYNTTDTARYGDTLKLYYSKGNILRVYNSSDTNGLNRDFILSGSEYYSLRNSSDTLYKYDVGSYHNFILTKQTNIVSPDSILGHPCRELKFKLVHVGKSIFSITDSYTYTKDLLPIDADHFRNFKYGHFNDFADEAGSFYSRYESTIHLVDNSDFGTKTIELVNIAPQHLDPAIFKLTKGPVKTLED